jgi:putative transposase
MDELNRQGLHLRKTFKYKLTPTPDQEHAMEFVVRRCRELYNAALQERKEAWEKCGVSITLAGQNAQLPDIKAVRPEYRAIHSQVLQDVLTRLDRTFQAFFRRVQEAGETPGYPRFKGSHRYTSFTYKQFGNGATLDNGFLVLSKIGRGRCVGPAGSKAPRRRSRLAGKPTAGMRASPVLTYQHSR